MKTILDIQRLNKSFNQTKILNDIHFKVREGEFLAIMGPSGSGKSTLLYNISGMDRPNSGTVLFEGENLVELADEAISDIRLKKMGFIFQHSHLLKNLSLQDNIILPGFKAQKQSREEVKQTAFQLMERMGILGVSTNDIKKVSGGQLQRAAICRALINQPTILFGDEPTGSLNSRATNEVMDTLNEINIEGTAVIIVTHDAKVASRAERVLFIKDGNIQDEFTFEKYNLAADNLIERERTLTSWLDEQGL